MASVFNTSGGSAFGSGGRAFGQFRLVNDPNQTDFGKYLAQISDPGTRANLGLGGSGQEENDANQQFAFNTYLQFLADNGRSNAELQAFRNKYNDALAAYQLRAAEVPEQNIRFANFLSEVDNDQTWRGWSPRTSGRAQLFDRVRFAG